MRRYVSRHWSVRSHRSYIPLSSSDTQLDSAAAAAAECPRNARGSAEEIAREEEVTSERRDDSNSSSSTRKRRWFRHLRRRKKHGDGDVVVVVQQQTLPCEEFEVAVEASMNNYDVRPGMSSHVVEHGSLSLLTAPRARTNSVELDLQALDLATTINKSGFYQRAEERQQLTRPARRFAICEELEREMIMENGMNLRKSRKNLVIRQVLHDLLLL